MKFRIISITLLLSMIIAFFCSCNIQTSKKKDNLLEGSEGTITTNVSYDSRFGAAKINMVLDDFENAGIELGDSCDVFFENGYTLRDVPFYNGYYVKNGEPIIVAYPGYSYISITLNNLGMSKPDQEEEPILQSGTNSLGIWNQAELSEDDKVTIKLNTKKKYSAIQDSLGQVYSFERKDYETDIEFANFRTLKGGNLRDDIFYRGASPVDNSRNRAPYVNQLLEEKDVGFIINLADTDEAILEFFDNSEGTMLFTETLYEFGKIATLGMNSNYQSEAYAKLAVSGLCQMLDNTTSESKVYVHCLEGKDRTGFVCMLIEALSGASYYEMLADYMETYKNYYKVTKETTSEKYNAIAELYFDSFMEFLCGTSNKDEFVKDNYVNEAKDYLRFGQMGEERIEELITFISK